MSENEGKAGPKPRALVTGAAKRVGRATALALARAGFDVTITYRGSRDDAQRTAAEIAGLPGSPRGEALELDLSDLDAVARFGERLAGAGRLDVLVHNASSYDRTALEGLTPKQAMDAYAVNAAAPAVLSSRLAARLAESDRPGGGAIVSMCDVHALGEHGLPRSREFLAYAMSKGALAEMTRTLARELAPRVRVNGVALGVAAWPDAGYESDRAAQEAYLKRVPLGRAGTPEDAAEAVRWLAVDAAYVTGQILRVDGGRSLV